MSRMQGNPHYAWASDALENEANAEGSYLNPQEAALRTAAIEATLTLAHEQRMANLIALYADGNTGTAPSINYVELLDQIKEGLGL